MTGAGLDSYSWILAVNVCTTLEVQRRPEASARQVGHIKWGDRNEQAYSCSRESCQMEMQSPQNVCLQTNMLGRLASSMQMAHVASALSSLSSLSRRAYLRIGFFEEDTGVAHHAPFERALEGHVSHVGQEHVSELDLAVFGQGGIGLAVAKHRLEAAGLGEPGCFESHTGSGEPLGAGELGDGFLMQDCCNLGQGVERRADAGDGRVDR